MNKLQPLFIAISITLITSISNAGEFAPLREKKSKNFPELKSMVLKTIEQRELILSKEKNCVTNANSEKELRLCFKEAQSERKTMTDDIKSKHKSRAN